MFILLVVIVLAVTIAGGVIIGIGITRQSLTAREKDEP
jgi:hypothetical protein